MKRYVKSNTELPPMEDIKQDILNKLDFGMRSKYKLSPDILRQLAMESNPRFRRYVAGDSNTASDTLKQLAGDEDTVVRSLTAYNSNTPATTLYQLADDSSKVVRESVIHNPNVPADILRQFATDPDNHLRYEVAKNPNTPVDVLRELANNRVAGVREGVAENPNTPVDVLDILTKDKYADVSKLARRNLSKRESTSGHSSNRSAVSVEGSVVYAVDTNRYEDTFDAFYQACWDKLLDDRYEQHPNLEVDQNTQGRRGSTSLYDDGFDSFEYYEIDESEAVSNVEALFNSGCNDISKGVEAIYNAGMWCENDDYDYEY